MQHFHTSLQKEVSRMIIRRYINVLEKVELMELFPFYASHKNKLAIEGITTNVLCHTVGEQWLAIFKKK